MHITQSKFLSGLFYPLIKFTCWFGKKFPVKLVQIRYFFRFYRFPNLRKPRDLNEKILWLKLYSDTSEWSKLADKLLVREYIKQKGLDYILIPLLGVWEDAEQINFKKLPKNLIFKGTHNHTMRIIDNSEKSYKGIRCELKRWLAERNVGLLAAEPHYSSIQPKIIAETLLPCEKDQKSLVDYKIWCINGKALYIWTCANRDSTSTEVMTYDRDWQPHPEYSIFTPNYKRGNIIQRPTNLDIMLVIAEKLSNGFPILRVDLYNVGGKIYFGELTFTSLGGMMNFYTQEFLDLLGGKADISRIKKIK